MIDLLYMLVAVPVCAALASISVCRLNYLDPHESKIAWIARYLFFGFMAAGVGLEALLHPQVFSSDTVRALWRVVGLGSCSIVLWAVYTTRHAWMRRYRSQVVEQAPSESNRAPLRDM